MNSCMKGGDSWGNRGFPHVELGLDNTLVARWGQS